MTGPRRGLQQQDLAVLPVGRRQRRSGAGVDPQPLIGLHRIAPARLDLVPVDPGIEREFPNGGLNVVG